MSCSEASRLQSLKDFLRVTHDADDAMLALLLAAADDEMVAFLGSIVMPAAPSVELGIFMLVRAAYEVVDAAEADRWRELGKRTAWPYREGLGV